MKTDTIDIRLLKIAHLLEKYTKGDFSVREPYIEGGDQVDDIIRKLDELGDRIQASGQVIIDYERRVSAIMDLLLKYTAFDFTEKAPISEVGDEIDAISLALNTLGDELNERIIQERKHTQELEKLAVVIETTADAVLSLDPFGLITLWNKSAERIFGYTTSEMIGRNLFDFTPKGRQPEIQDHLQQVKGGQQIVDAETQWLTKDGRTIVVSITLTPIFGPNGTLSSISAVSRDITEQKRAQELLKESENLYRTLVEGVEDYAILSLDPWGTITSWNEGAEKIKGYTAGEIIGKSFSIFYTEEDRAAHVPFNFLNEAAAKGRAVHEGYRVRRDGSRFWGLITLTCLRDDEGNIKGFSKITRDLTEAKLKDEEIRRSNQRLEQKNIELERMNKELASFAYVSSHDLQEPLRKIQTFASRVLETDNENLSEQGHNYFDRIRSSANRMQRLLQDILDYSRLSTSEDKFEDIDLKKIILEVKEDFAETLEEKKGRLEVGEFCNAPVIPFQFRQLITNLVSNALKFSEPLRPPVITISARGHQPPVKHAKDTSYCCITVSDNGIGFEPRFKEQIFEVFQRLHGHDAYPGTGIGLAICKKIADNHNGFIKATSELGKGTAFDIYLPFR